MIFSTIVLRKIKTRHTLKKALLNKNRFFCKKGHIPQRIWLKTCVWIPKNLPDLNPRAGKWAIPGPKKSFKRGVPVRLLKPLSPTCQPFSLDMTTLLPLTTTGLCCSRGLGGLPDSSSWGSNDTWWSREVSHAGKEASVHGNSYGPASGRRDFSCCQGRWHLHGIAESLFLFTDW